jgi:altronate hydrolase
MNDDMGVGRCTGAIPAPACSGIRSNLTLWLPPLTFVPMRAKGFADFAVLLRDNDNVAVLKRAVKSGDELANGAIQLRALENIGAGHKIAITEIADGAPVRRYGQIIGFAQGRIGPGAHVHTHNVVMKEFGRDYQFCADARPVNYHATDKMRYFQGFARPGGNVGTRNYVAVISSVNCSASVSHYVRNRFRTEEFKRDFPNVDGVIAFTHKGGCAMDPGEPQQILQRVLAGIAQHPNISGYVMIGLGCETNQIDAIRASHKLDSTALNPSLAAPVFMNIQSVGGVRKTVEAGVAAVTKLLRVANEFRRTKQPTSKLILAENCGGSDGNSGITANPALGVASDELVRYGGTSVLAETPEIYGAEHLLTRRAVSRDVGEKLVEMVHWWEEHARRHNCSINNNPSHGNKEGGLTNIYEKSLGAIAKGGQSPLAAVYKYAEKITTPGFCFMDTPGYDPVSMTGLVAGGCNVAVFTTGRGSVYGCKPTPCIKVATNTPLYNWMEEDMDINAGTILDGTETVEQVGMRIFEKIIAVAGGENTKSELAGIGDEEFAPWTLGPVF